MSNFARRRKAFRKQLLTIIPLDDIWITANFKETQLRNMKPGQAVTVYADSTGRDYRAHVDALGGATGSKFSLLPAENATGNFTKIVQRVPVKILIEPTTDPVLDRIRAGLSVEATIDTRTAPPQGGETLVPPSGGAS